MKLKARIVDVDTGGVHKILLNPVDITQLAMFAGERVLLKHKKSETVAIADSTSLVDLGQVGILNEVQRELHVKEGDLIEVNSEVKTTSIKAIRKKMDGLTLSEEEIQAIVEDLVSGRLTDIDTAAFLVSEHILGLNLEETVHLTRAMAEEGKQLDFGTNVFDKHSIGGVPGNKVSLIIVPIVAAAGLLIPKTSSRAITSPSGTADTMEVLADVEFSVEELQKIVKNTKAAIVWGGSLNLAPADDLFIHVEHPLQIDPRPQMIASIIAKKLSTGVQHLVLDIPTGEGCKVTTMEEARKLSRDFITVGTELGINVHCAMTYGSQPVGHAIGPALEAKEALETLMGGGPTSLIEKSTGLAGILLEMGGLAPRGAGRKLAKDILASGKALEKMRLIIEAQNGKASIGPSEIPIGTHTSILRAPTDGYVATLQNRALVRIARAAGTPKFHGAGLYLHAKIGSRVREGDPVITIYAESEGKLSDAIDVAKSLMPFTVEGMLLRTVTDTEQYSH
ncbi:MAG: AMP phosphorylase [Promethearchaeota archaeon]